MNKYQERANRSLALAEQQKAECREACFDTFDKMGPGRMKSGLERLARIKSAEKDSAMAVVIEIGLLEMDLILAEWMASRAEGVQ